MTIKEAISQKGGEVSIWPSLETTSFVYKWANIALVFSLAVGLISTFLIIWTGGIKEKYSRRDLDAASKRATDAEGVATTARQELEKFKKPRELTTEQVTIIANALKPLAGTSFDMACADNQESMKLLGQIEDALNVAGWKELGWTGGASIVIARPNKPSIGRAVETGVSVQFEPEQQTQLGPATATLVFVLINANIQATAEIMPIPRNDNHNAVHVIVGEKPQ
jgi:hypothetical protein